MLLPENGNFFFVKSKNLFIVNVSYIYFMVMYPTIFHTKKRSLLLRTKFQFHPAAKITKFLATEIMWTKKLEMFQSCSLPWSLVLLNPNFCVEQNILYIFYK